MQLEKVIGHISSWLRNYCDKSKTCGFVVGVSGGIDSALTSTLCALSGKQVLCLEMPIHQSPSQVDRAQEHIRWLKENFSNVTSERVELTAVFEQFRASVNDTADSSAVQMALANTRARLRMTALYYYAGLNKMLVAGTGNKIEDFGIGFFTKYGDGGVDLSPIADLTKTEVYALSKHLRIADSILNAAPTDGLFGDNRTDADQIGASYPELEWAMQVLTPILNQSEKAGESLLLEEVEALATNDREREVLKIYLERHKANKHKMNPIPVCFIPNEWK